MLCEFVSKLPPSCGVVSFNKSEATVESIKFTVFADVSIVANDISSDPSKNLI